MKQKPWECFKSWRKKNVLVDSLHNGQNFIFNFVFTHSELSTHWPINSCSCNFFYEKSKIAIQGLSHLFHWSCLIFSKKCFLFYATIINLQTTNPVFSPFYSTGVKFAKGWLKENYVLIWSASQLVWYFCGIFQNWIAPKLI